MWRKLLCLGALAFIFLIAIYFIIAPRENSQIRTQYQAEQKARKIFQLYKWNVYGEVKIEKPKVGSKERMNFWSVRIGEYYAEFDGVDGQLRLLMNFKKEFRMRDTAIININEKVADEKAISYLKIAGFELDGAKIISSKTENYTTRPGNIFWNVLMRRYYYGYEFYDDTISVNLDPQNGELMGFGYYFYSPLPKSTSVKLSKQKAISQAYNLVHGMGKQMGNVFYSKLKIVIPNNYWDVESKKIAANKYAKKSYSRLAWIIGAQSPWHRIEIWVDADTGEIIGSDRDL